MLTNQTLAVTATLIWVLRVEEMLAAFSGGALVFAGYGLVFSAAGNRLLRSRDIA
jgi:hypothetical protein